jgi:exonuclease VII small subunit
LTPTSVTFEKEVPPGSNSTMTAARPTVAHRHVRLLTPDEKEHRPDDGEPVRKRGDELARARAERAVAVATFERAKAALDEVKTEGAEADRMLDEAHRAYEEARATARRTEIRLRDCRRRAEWARTTLRRATEWVSRLEELEAQDALGGRASSA